MQAPCLLPYSAALTPPCWVPVGLKGKENSNIRIRVMRAEPAFPLSTQVVYPRRLFLVDNVHLWPLYLISTSEKPERIREEREDDSVLSGFSLALDLIPNSAAHIIHIDILRYVICLGYAKEPIIATPYSVFIEY